MPHTDTALARQVASAAGDLLLLMRHSGLLTGKPLGQAGDLAASTFITAALRAHRPADAILSEEEKDDLSRCSASRVWIIDPLDGTREYSESRADWAVHVALAVNREAAVGAVALPGLGLTLASDGTPVRAATGPPRRGQLRIVVSRTRPAAEAAAVAEALGAELVPMGSAGAKAMAVVRNEADAYLHSGGQFEWDSCAPAAVAMAAGLHVSRIDGSSLVYNQPDPAMPDLLVCRQEHAERFLSVIATVSPRPHL
jgi:3'(2'), 5'-bisphosphate nucleotidase